MSFRQTGYCKVPNFVPEEILDWVVPHCRRLVWSPASSPTGTHMHFTDTGRQCYGDRYLDGLLIELQDAVESVVEKTLIPTYSFLRFYPKKCGLRRHKDRASCQYSVSICIEQDYGNLKGRNPDYEWPLFCDETPLSTKPGDAVFYKGMVVAHSRNALEGRSQTQLFLHYVDALDPDYRKYRFDGREALGEPPRRSEDPVGRRYTC